MPLFFIFFLMIENATQCYFRPKLKGGKRKSIKFEFSRNLIFIFTTWLLILIWIDLTTHIAMCYIVSNYIVVKFLL